MKSYQRQTQNTCRPGRLLFICDVTWPRPLPVWPVDGAKGKPSVDHISVTIMISMRGFHCRVPLDVPYKAPKPHVARRHGLGVGPPKPKFYCGRPWLFTEDIYRAFFRRSTVGYSRVLSTVKVWKQSDQPLLRKWGLRFLGALHFDELSGEVAWSRDLWRPQSLRLTRHFCITV